MACDLIPCIREGETMRTLFPAVFFLFFSVSVSAAGLVLGPEQVVRAGGADIFVPGYSVPSFVDWDSDGLKDLVVGEGSGLTGFGLVRVYINSGTPGNPVFTGYFHAQANGSDLQSPGGG
jgi:hypothetical protein